ncbi:MAG TPA: hypothetical protein VFV23_12760 [Verrucomicrobiae bacterium]|nr:hypothetical protein [Verrucomicrobiae bacterium]
MSNPNDFTPKELFIISLYKEPAKLFHKSILRTTLVLGMSLCIAVAAFLFRDIACAVLAYALLLIFNIIRAAQLKRGLQTISSIVWKYEAKLQRNSNHNRVRPAPS